MDIAQCTMLWSTCLSQAKQDWTATVIKKVFCGKSSLVAKGYACLECALRAQIHYLLRHGVVKIELFDGDQRERSDCAEICSFEIVTRFFFQFYFVVFWPYSRSSYHYLKVSLQIQLSFSTLTALNSCGLFFAMLQNIPSCISKNIILWMLKCCLYIIF